jgi:hypothetical protein
MPATNAAAGTSYARPRATLVADATISPDTGGRISRKRPAGPIRLAIVVTTATIPLLMRKGVGQCTAGRDGYRDDQRASCRRMGRRSCQLRLPR